ncbi:MAG: CPBP family intramembrane metalloprotease [Ruminococcus sp.]|nr:CPBP family intramembrane metalloprotease [Ruminococcus sp.]
MSKLSKDYLIFTFSIMLLCWGACILCSLNGVALDKNYLLYIPFLLGGWSPTIASYIALKKNKEISELKEWIKNVFDLKHNVFSYVLVVVLAILFLLPQCFVAGYESGAPLYAIIIMIPMMIVGGGLEEAGWRYILQPELEKKCSFTLSTLIVSVIWWLWHMPLFFINGAGQYGQDYLVFGLTVLGLSFALASIRKNTGSVWLCVLFHCIVNALSGIYVVNDTICGGAAAAAVLVLLSYAVTKINSINRLFS